VKMKWNSISADNLFTIWKHIQAEITQLAALSRSTPDVSSSSLLLVGTEHNSLLIIDPHTFNAISRVSLMILTEAETAIYV
jgi:hypothetical protein